MLPSISGAPIRVTIRTPLGSYLGATSIPHRIIYLDPEVLHAKGDFERILVHEIFHFAWVRLSNEARRDWEKLLEAELRRRVKGELGWSAELRKLKLTRRDIRERTTIWRHYACESFCDSAARLYSGLIRHDEFTLPKREVRRRAAWLTQTFESRGLRL